MPIRRSTILHGIAGQARNDDTFGPAMTKHLARYEQAFGLPWRISEQS